MLNGFFVALVLVAVLVAAFAGGMEAVTRASLDSAKDAVTLAIGLIGVMAFFLGLMRVASDGGLLRILARALWPAMRLLFPRIPRDHPALPAMILNIASNLLGLGNAATPFGIKAMMELDRLNGRKGTATNEMIVFLAINTSGLAVLPSGVIGVRAAAGSADPAGIFFPTWFASGTATIVGVTVAILLARLPAFRRTSPPAADEPPSGAVVEPDPDTGLEAAAGGGPDEETPLRPPRWGRLAAILWTVGLVAALIAHLIRSSQGDGIGAGMKDVLSYWLLPALIAGIVLFGWARGVRVYASLVEGAKEGFRVAVRIIPYLVAILVAVGMFRASGALAAIVSVLDPVTGRIGVPAEALSIVFMRPLSGQGAFALMTEILRTHGPDSILGYLSSTMTGATETTFYVLAVYFGAIGVRRTRHALPACLSADLAGMAAAVLIVNLLYR